MRIGLDEDEQGPWKGGGGYLEPLKPVASEQGLRMASLEEKSWRGAAIKVISETVATDCTSKWEDERLSRMR